MDWRVHLDEASERLGGIVPVEGNLDPALLSAPSQTVAAHVDEVLERGRAAPAHVVNLGGELPDGTDLEVLARIVRRVRGDDTSL